MSLTWRRVGGIRLICFPISTGGVGGKRIHIHQIHNSTPGDEIHFEILLRGLQKSAETTASKNLIRSQRSSFCRQKKIWLLNLWCGNKWYHGIPWYTVLSFWYNRANKGSSYRVWWLHEVFWDDAFVDGEAGGLHGRGGHDLPCWCVIFHQGHEFPQRHFGGL